MSSALCCYGVVLNTYCSQFSYAEGYAVADILPLKTVTTHQGYISYRNTTEIASTVIGWQFPNNRAILQITTKQLERLKGESGVCGVNILNTGNDSYNVVFESLMEAVGFLLKELIMRGPNSKGKCCIGIWTVNHSNMFHFFRRTD